MGFLVFQTPASLSENLAHGEAGTQTLSIANSGDADLTYLIDVSYTVVCGGGSQKWIYNSLP